VSHCTQFHKVNFTSPVVVHMFIGVCFCVGEDNLKIGICLWSGLCENLLSSLCTGKYMCVSSAEEGVGC
jgi:hypothetical protein